MKAKHQIEIMEVIMRKRSLQTVKDNIDRLREIVLDNPDISIDLARLAQEGLPYVESLPKQLEASSESV